MSDPVLIAIIVGIPACISAVTGMLNSFAIARGNRHIVETKDAMNSLEKHTNSMKDALVKITGESEFAKGMIRGTDEGARRDDLVRVTGESEFAKGLKQGTEARAEKES